MSERTDRQRERLRRLGALAAGLRSGLALMMRQVEQVENEAADALAGIPERPVRDGSLVRPVLKAPRGLKAE